MARPRLLLIVLIALVMTGCSLFRQQENFISFTWDGMQYLFTASAGPSDHPYAVGYAAGVQDPTSYRIWGSATPEDAAAVTNTIFIHLWLDTFNGVWAGEVLLYESAQFQYTYVPLNWIPEDWIDSLIANRDAVGEQFTGSMPGPFQGVETLVLENIVFSVERLANQEPPLEN